MRRLRQAGTCTIAAIQQVARESYPVNSATQLPSRRFARLGIEEASAGDPTFS